MTITYLTETPNVLVKLQYTDGNEAPPIEVYSNSSCKAIFTGIEIDRSYAIIVDGIVTVEVDID